MLYIHLFKIRFIECHCVPSPVPETGFTVVNQTDVVLALKDHKVELGKQTINGQRDQC